MRKFWKMIIESCVNPWQQLAPHCKLIDKKTYILQVRQFQNEFMMSSFLPKYERKIVRISALCSAGGNLDIFCSYFGRNDEFKNAF